jgi:hypothetical protein
LEYLDSNPTQEIKTIGYCYDHYFGLVNDNGLKHGVGRHYRYINNDDYCLYEGCYKEGMRSGYGRAIYSTFIYEGQWENDEFKG